MKCSHIILCLQQRYSSVGEFAINPNLHFYKLAFYYLHLCQNR